MGGVAAQIDQDVDGIIADGLGEGRVVQAGHRVPVSEVLAQTQRDMVFDGVVGVGMQGEGCR